MGQSVLVGTTHWIQRVPVAEILGWQNPAGGKWQICDYLLSQE